MKTIIVVLSIILTFSIIGNVVNYTDSYSSIDQITLSIGIDNSPTALDPIEALDSSSYDVINQVVESLFWYDFRDPSLPLEPLLISDYSWNSNNTIWHRLPTLC